MSKYVDPELIERLHNEGLSAPEIAHRVGCSDRTVTRWRRANGLTKLTSPNAGKPISPERLEAARRMLDDGASYADVQTTLGIQQDTVRRHFPGRAWSPQQVAQYLVMVRAMHRLEGVRQ